CRSIGCAARSRLIRPIRSICKPCAASDTGWRSQGEGANSMTSAVEAFVPAVRGVRHVWRRVARSVAELMPTGLFARSLIIIIAPVVLLQAFVAFVLMEEHFRTVTARLSAA